MQTMSCDFFTDKNGVEACAPADLGEPGLGPAILRILRCTALALTCEPGGLRYKPGSRPWLPVVAEFSPNRQELSQGTGS